MSDKKVALVTGGNRGIGWEVCQQLLQQEFCVILACRNTTKVADLPDHLEAARNRLEVLELDVTDVKSIQRVVQAFEARHERLDVLINNAGILLDASESILSVSEETIRQTLDTNSLGPLRVTKAFLPCLKKSDDARVINVSSLAGQLKSMNSWAPAYSLSKTALNAISCLLASELETHGIKVNAVSPGWIRTDMGGPGAPGTLEEGADTILWLATEASSAISGQFLRDRQRTDW